MFTSIPENALSSRGKMQTNLSILEGQPNCVFALEKRNELAQETIGKWAKRHAAMDVAIGLTAFVPFPGATTAALIGAILAQAPLIYKPMTAELAAIYSSSPDQITSQIQQDAVMLGAGADIAIELGTEFLKEIASELIGEAALGFGLSAIPFFGAFLAAGLDATVAATLTWRVGTMVSAYYQNGESWLGTRKQTYRAATKIVNGFSPETRDRANLDDLGRRSKYISERQLNFVLGLVEMMRGITANREQIKSALRDKKIPMWLIERALQQAFA